MRGFIKQKTIQWLGRGNKNTMQWFCSRHAFLAGRAHAAQHPRANTVMIGIPYYAIPLKALLFNNLVLFNTCYLTIQYRANSYLTN